jgi:3-methyladenine DNA glycosylase AlkD
MRLSLFEDRKDLWLLIKLTQPTSHGIVLIKHFIRSPKALRIKSADEKTTGRVLLDTERLYREIVAELERRADAKRAEKEMYYHKKVGEGFKAYGISAPEFYEIAKKYQNVFKQLTFKERITLAERFFESGYAGQMSFGIILLKLSVKEMKPKDFGVLEIIGACLNNWGSTDGFCIDVLQPLLLVYPREVLRVLKEWNKAESLWKRRASVVVFTRKVGASGKFTNEALELCDRLVLDAEDYVRKGVGWALKDTMRGDKKKVLEYVKGLRQKEVSAVITLYAIRDLKGKERREVLNVKP